MSGTTQPTRKKPTPMSLTITEGSVPEVTTSRTREPNPFEGRFPTAEGKSLIVDLPSRTADEKKYVEKVKNQAHTAAREAISDTAPRGYTARVKMEAAQVTVKSDKGKDVQVEGTRLTIWTVDRIFRPNAGRKPKGSQS